MNGHDDTESRAAARSRSPAGSNHGAPAPPEPRTTEHDMDDHFETEVETPPGEIDHEFDDTFAEDDEPPAPILSPEDPYATQYEPTPAPDSPLLPPGKARGRSR